MKKWMQVLLMGLVLVAGAVSAQASTVYGDVDNLSFLTTSNSESVSSLTGSFSLAYLGNEAGHTNALYLQVVGWNNDKLIFSSSSSVGALSSNSYDISKLYFSDETDNKPSSTGAFNVSDYVAIYKLTTDVSLAGSVLLSGTYILGFNDNTVNSDDDFDDLVVAAWQSGKGIQPVPVPAAVWMLGTGLVGVMGMRWRQRA